MTLVAILTVRSEARDAFVRFERAAAAIMRRHGGAIERTVTVSAPPAPAGTFREVHLVSFPDGASFTAYREDPALVALAGLRDQALAATEILLGELGPDYHAPGGCLSG
jgi:hypothetical protein